MSGWHQSGVNLASILDTHHRLAGGVSLASVWRVSLIFITVSRAAARADLQTQPSYRTVPYYPTIVRLASVWCLAGVWLTSVRRQSLILITVTRAAAPPAKADLQTQPYYLTTLQSSV